MKKNEFKEYKNKSFVEIEKKLLDLKKQITKAYLDKKATKLVNVSSIRILRGDIAKLKTLLTEKQLLSQLEVDKE